MHSKRIGKIVILPIDQIFLPIMASNDPLGVKSKTQSVAICDHLMNSVKEKNNHNTIVPALVALLGIEPNIN